MTDDFADLDDRAKENQNLDLPASTIQKFDGAGLLETGDLQAQFDHRDVNAMVAFYQRLYPFKLVFQWLNHSPAPQKDFTYREFAFTLQNDAYLRYLSFNDWESLKREAARVNPSRFEIGPVYSANPRDRKTLRKAAFKPIQKELVFDIDLTDYDDVRTCCQKANICNKCWRFIIQAIKVVDSALREDFGYEHVLWVYSGRRGAHAWVCDKKARALDDSGRRAVATYLEVVRGGNQGGKKVELRRPLHPSIARSLEILKSSFTTNVLLDQDPWRNAEGYERVLAYISDKDLKDALRRKWQADQNRASSKKWADIDALAEAGVSKNLDTKALMNAKQDIVLEHIYPRLDIEVSKHLNHLLKAPFCVHPGTGRICVPIDIEKVESFDPLQVPTLSELLQEIEDWDRQQREDEKSPDTGRTQSYEKTSLKPFVEHFKQFVNGLNKHELGTKRPLEETTLDF